MKKVLEQLAAEENILQKHNVYVAVQGSIACVAQDLEPPRKSKADYDIAKNELGHAYVLVGAVEHIEEVRLKQIRNILDHYAKQLGYKPNKEQPK